MLWRILLLISVTTSYTISPSRKKLMMSVTSHPPMKTLTALSAGFGKDLKPSSSSSSNGWSKLDIPSSDLPSGSQIKVFDTDLDKLKDSLTNPKGAICVGKFEEKLFCFQSLCTQCKIPFTGGNIFSSGKVPTLKCGFCNCEFNLTNGEQTPPTKVSERSTARAMCTKLTKFVIVGA